jgi:hypothetical protein
MELIDRSRHIPGASSLTVVLKNGSRLTEPLQTPSDLKGWEQTLSKFNESVGTLLTDTQQRTIVESVQAIQDISSIRNLTRALQQGQRN